MPSSNPRTIVTETRLVEMLLQSRSTLDLSSRGRAEAVGPCTFIAPRVIDEHLIHYNRRGQTAARIAGKEIVIPPGALLWVQPGARQEVRLPRGEACVAYLRFRFGSRRCPRLQANYILCERASWADSLLRELSLGRQHGGSLESLRHRSILAQLLCEILQLADAPPAGLGGLQPHQQRRCLEFIHDNLARRYSVAELAKHCQLNPAYLTMQFRKSFGMTPRAYIKQSRVRAAAGMLLETGRTISQVADDLGYNDVYFFSRQFRQVTGQSPRFWRRQHDRR
ncbi:MAG: helix-turn-helix transcriptional regulator [Phycisphaerae bacterium]|nr:helix-turn-helix transcriptional regulator [Phycisphaerae bacterium]